MTSVQGLFRADLCSWLFVCLFVRSLVRRCKGGSSGFRGCSLEVRGVGRLIERQVRYRWDEGLFLVFCCCRVVGGSGWWNDDLRIFMRKFAFFFSVHV